MTQYAKEHVETVELLWPLGHRGIRGNERNDDLARLGIGKSMMFPGPAVKISDAKIKEKNKEVWMKAKDCRQPKAYVSEELSND